MIRCQRAEELVGVPGPLVRQLPAHADVASDRDRRDPVVRAAPFEAPEAFPEAEGEDEDPDAEDLRGHQVAGLVDEDDDADGQQEGRHREEEGFHCSELRRVDARGCGEPR